MSIYYKFDVEPIKGSDGHLKHLYKCKKCGTIKWLRDIDAKDTNSCRHRLYGMENKRIKSIYCGMMARCYNHNDKNYRFYGAKGVQICDEWKFGIKFEEWALSHGYKNELTIDRINSSLDYSPDNCRWISLEENSRHKKSTNEITVNGETLSGIQWAQKLGFGKNYINTYKRKNGIEKTIEFIKENL